MSLTFLRKAHLNSAPSIQPQQKIAKKRAAKEWFSLAAVFKRKYVCRFRQTVLGTRRACVNLDWMLEKIPFRFKLGLLEEVQAPLFSWAVASE